MGGTSMAVEKRWAKDSFYVETVFNGTALDIGAAGDPLPRYRTDLPNLTTITCLDLDVAPAAYSDTVWIQGQADRPPEGQQFDVVYSSHCLEHLYQHTLPVVARMWWAAVRPGGHLLVIVPDMEMYERGEWPSRYNGDHKTAWRIERAKTDPHYVQSLADFVSGMEGAEIVSLKRLDANYRPGGVDQTATGECESGIEIVVRKRNQ